MMNALQTRLLCLLAAFSMSNPGPVVAAELVPREHADFAFYTFALTWQPGICATGEGCLADQPKMPLIGLHGLWASLPRGLAERNITSPEWWQRGCDYYRHSDAVPPLDSALHQRLEDVMPHFAHDLLTHEYDKHVQCFAFDPATFFTTELALRQSVVDSMFARFLYEHIGLDVAHDGVRDAFGAAFSLPPGSTSLQLQCGHDAAGHAILTQLWISIPVSGLAAFPQPAAFIDAPIPQDDCPTSFRIPDWPTP